jgi:hypothetical protein
MGAHEWAHGLRVWDKRQGGAGLRGWKWEETTWDWDNNGAGCKCGRGQAMKVGGAGRITYPLQ